MNKVIAVAVRAALMSAALALSISAEALAIDPAAAETLAKDSKCFKCHTPDRSKDGPSYRDVAAKYKSKPDAHAQITKHVTSGEKVKFADGHYEEHKKVKTKDLNEIKNLVNWIQSLEGGTAY
jgi:cytochrome c